MNIRFKDTIGIVCYLLYFLHLYTCTSSEVSTVRLTSWGSKKDFFFIWILYYLNNICSRRSFKEKLSLNSNSALSLASKDQDNPLHSELPEDPIKVYFSLSSSGLQEWCFSCTASISMRNILGSISSLFGFYPFSVLPILFSDDSRSLLRCDNICSVNKHVRILI